MLMSELEAETLARNATAALMGQAERLHLTGAEVAGIMGVSLATVNNWKKTPPKDLRTVVNARRASKILAEIDDTVAATLKGRARADHRRKVMAIRFGQDAE